MDDDNDQAVVNGTCVCGTEITYRVGDPALCARCRAREEDKA